MCGLAWQGFTGTSPTECLTRKEDDGWDGDSKGSQVRHCGCGYVGGMGVDSL